MLIEPDSPAGLKSEPLPLDDAIVESPIENLDLVPADIRLARFEMQPDYLTHRLNNQIKEHGASYDLVFLDCPPQLGKLLTAALYAVINLYKPSRNLSAESRQAVEAAIKLVGHVFDMNLHDYSKVAEAPSQKLPAVLYAKSHRAADQWWGFTDEVLEKLRMPKQKIVAIK
ncbi:MAG: chromosome partitioning protein [Acidobacteriota bacterium]|nr:chromosome partitioning protein [Acidobacteriota bacterium]